MLSDIQYVRRASSIKRDEEEAIAEIVTTLNRPETETVILFCSPEYDPERLAAAIRKLFQCRVIGCTTAGEITAKYQQNGIVGLSLDKRAFKVHTVLIDNLQNTVPVQIERTVMDIEAGLQMSETFNPERMFGFLLIDGLSNAEEHTIATIYNTLRDIPIIGGSAGDNLKFKDTYVFADGEFSRDAAVFSIIETTLPFKTFKLQHFKPSDLDMVITEADASSRIVTEINGSPAAQEYAEILGMNIDNLSAQVFAAHPVMLQIGDEWYVRSISKVNDDGSLSFACAIDEGLPLTVAEGVGFVETLKDKIEQLQAEFSRIYLTLGCECAFRVIEIMEKGIQKDVEDELSKINFFGFVTYGEQFNAIHVNQTLTGVVIGDKY
ncbi:MAG: FIST N-terminal domain-containing protein [Chromatiales bacterium]